ncbi:MAG TPA: glutamyl-tRNA reductase [Bdellovibrionota bacterium]|nr:glutamyl-tRNA reductase [Bdellovibrionota bacterium]
MDLVVLGLNHKTAPLEVREQLDFSKHPKDVYLKKLADRQSISSGMVLSTCNRVEIYAAGEGEAELLVDVEQFLGEFHRTNRAELRHFLYTKTNREAVRHLFRVAASLDSMIIGEPQILGQVKEAYFDAISLQMTNPFFDKLIQKTFSVAKKIRTETKIAEQAVSVSHAAVDLAERIFGDLADRKVLIWGAGEMAELTAKNLARRKVQQMAFTNRSYEHSAQLARSYGGVPVPMDQADHYLADADIVIVSTAAPHYVVTRHRLETLVATRKRMPMFFIDISVPRNVEPSVHELDDVYLYNIDDLKGVVDANLELRREEAEKAEAIVELEVDRFLRLADRLSVAPVIQALQKKYDSVTEQEMKRILGRVPSLSEPDQTEIRRSIETVVRKVLNDPILFLKDDEARKERLRRAEMLAKVFRLEWTEEDEEA